MKNYCKTEGDFRKEFEEIKTELPESVFMYDDPDGIRLLHWARYRSMDYEAFPYGRSHDKDLKKLIKVLTKRGYIRQDLKMTLRIMKLYGFSWDCYYNDSRYIIRYDDSTYETCECLSANQIASVKRFIKKTLSPEEAFAIEKYYALDGGDGCSQAKIARQLGVGRSAFEKILSCGHTKLYKTGKYYKIQYGRRDRASFDYCNEMIIFVPSRPSMFDFATEDDKAQIEAAYQLVRDARDAGDAYEKQASEDAFVEKMIPFLDRCKRGSKTQEWAVNFVRKNWFSIPFRIDFYKSCWFEDGLPKVRIGNSRVVWTGDKIGTDDFMYDTMF